MERRMVTLAGMTRQKVAQEMAKQTPYPITADMVSYVKGENRMNVYSAQYGDVTVLCWIRPDDECMVKTVSW